MTLSGGDMADESDADEADSENECGDANVVVVAAVVIIVVVFCG